MAFLEGWRFLSSARFKMIIQTLAGKLDLTAPLIFLGRVPVVNAFDDEIVGRFTGRVFAADVIADDAAAAVYESGKLELVTNQIPNLKLGQLVNQTTINRLARMRQGALLPSDNNAMEAFFDNIARNLVQGVRVRMNMLICAMLCGLTNYERLGISIRNANWGVPANLLPTSAIAWSTDGLTANASALPITDILTIANEVGPDNYGQRYNRVTMSSKAFRFLVQTTQFANLAKAIFGFDFAAGASPVSFKDQPTMQAMVGRLLNMEVELYDAAFWERNPDGTTNRTRVLPANKVLLTNTDDDGDGNTWDFANGVVTESVVAGLANAAVAGPADEYGPTGYYTPASPDLNPPGYIAWGVARGFPRRHVNEAAACLTVGQWAA
jgi:hypothetical protein